MPETGTYSLSGGRRLAQQRASSDPTGTLSQRLACVASKPNGVEHCFMKPLSWDKQLGLVSPLESAAIQSGQTNNPSMDNDEAGDEMGLDVSHHTRISQRGGEKFFSLTSPFIG
jgi:hypothetical protein